jgi:hypothetical protein
MIVHPDEVMSARRQDLLYAGSRQGLLRNLLALVECVVREGHSFEFVTVSDAALRWRRHTGIL